MRVPPWQLVPEEGLEARLADLFLALACRQSVGGDAHAVRQLRVVPLDGGDHGINTSGCHDRQFLVEGSHVADMTSPVKTGSSSRAAVA